MSFRLLKTHNLGSRWKEADSLHRLLPKRKCRKNWVNPSTFSGNQGAVTQAVDSTLQHRCEVLHACRQKQSQLLFLHWDSPSGWIFDNRCLILQYNNRQIFILVQTSVAVPQSRCSVCERKRNWSSQVSLFPNSINHTSRSNKLFPLICIAEEYLSCLHRIKWCFS